MGESAVAAARRVRIIGYDASWPARYENEAPAVMGALGPLAIEIQHIGSTSVPGLAAKPTIDILVGARSLELDDEAVARLFELGYEYRGEMGVLGRRYFRKGRSYPRDFNVHLVVWRGALWDDYLAFRDYLRAHPQRARRYMDLKRQLVSTAGGDELAAYAEGKAAFIAKALRSAGEEAARRSRAG